MPETDVEKGKALAAISGGSVTQFRNPQSAAENADVIYTDTWTSMGQEEEAKKRQQVFPPYQVNQELVKLAKPQAIVMHCLPAHRGDEITDEVADGPHSRLFPQAENRMHAQKAILVECLLEGNPDAE
jgi:ornithine carbamoyltransferase